MNNFTKLRVISYNEAIEVYDSAGLLNGIQQRSKCPEVGPVCVQAKEYDPRRSGCDQFCTSFTLNERSFIGAVLPLLPGERMPIMANVHCSRDLGLPVSMRATASLRQDAIIALSEVEGPDVLRRATMQLSMPLKC
jgi:hypothetical protein